MFAALSISRVVRETPNVYKNENGGFILPGRKMSIGVNNHLINSRLFPRRNVEVVGNGYEDLSAIQFENNDNCEYNAPSTSTAFRPPSRSLQIAHNRNLSCIDVRRNNIEESGRILSSSVRSATFINGSVRRDISNREVPLTSNNIRNMSTLPRSFGLSSRGLGVHSDLSQWNNGRVDQDSNCRSNNDYVNTSSGKRTFGLGLRNGTLGGNNLLQESTVTNHNMNSTICRTSNNHINMSAVSTNQRLPARNMFTSGLQMEESIRCNEGDTLNQTFRKPTLSRVLKCRNSTMSSRFFSHQNVEKHSRDLSNINGFNVTHISRRDQDTFSESRFLLRQQNMLDNQSVAGSVFSIASVKAQVMNVLENLHHSILNIVPNIPADVVRMEFDKAKEGLESINEMSYAPTIRETDAASVISHSSKFHYSALPDHIPGTVSERRVLLRSGKDVMNFLDVKNTRKTNSILSQVNEEERTVIHVTKSQDQQLSDDEKEDSALIFKKPKSVFRERKASRGLRIRTPQIAKNLKAKITNKIINLTEWYPVAVGGDLAFCGTDDGGTTLQTEAVKKRLTNRKLALVNGLECNLVGNPSNSIVSVFPKQILSQLQNGLTGRWKVLQNALQKLQHSQAANPKRQSRSSTSLDRSGKKSPGNKENVEVYPSTPRTRRKIPETEKGEDESHSTPVKAVAVKANLKRVMQKSPVKTPAVKSKNGRGRPKKMEKKISPDKEERVLKERKENKSPKGDTSPRKVEKGAVPHTRSGRTVKRPKKFWLVPGVDEVSSSEVVGTPQTVGVSDEPRKKKWQKKVEESSGKKPLSDDGQKEQEGADRVHSSTEDAELRTRKQSQNKRKREVVGDADSTSRKRSKSEKSSEPLVESTIEDVEKSGKNAKVSKGKHKGRGRPQLNRSQDSNPGRKGNSKQNKKKKENANSSLVKKDGKELNDFEDDDFELQLDDIEIPEMAKVSGKPKLNRSLLKLVSMETPPLKYFNNNLRIKKMTPEPSPEWCISQRTNSEVKQFQLRRAQAHKRKTKTTTTKKKVEKTKSVANTNKDLKSVLNWVAEKEVRTPVSSSQVLKYVMPSRKKMEEDDDEEEEEDEEEFET